MRFFSIFYQLKKISICGIDWLIKYLNLNLIKFNYILRKWENSEACVECVNTLEMWSLPHLVFNWQPAAAPAAVLMFEFRLSKCPKIVDWFFVFCHKCAFSPFSIRAFIWFLIFFDVISQLNWLAKRNNHSIVVFCRFEIDMINWRAAYWVNVTDFASGAWSSFGLFFIYFFASCLFRLLNKSILPTKLNLCDSFLRFIRF